MAEASDLSKGIISRSALQEDLIKYLDTDTLLYWEDEGSELRLKQDEYWGPALKLFSSKMNLPSFQITDGLFELRQDEKIESSFKNWMETLNNFQLAGIYFELSLLCL